MKGYFSSLAKQSGVLVRAGKAIGPPNPSPQPAERIAPLHSETIHFVDPARPAMGLARDNPPIERTAHQALSENWRVRDETSSISSRSESASSGFTRSDPDSLQEVRINGATGPEALVETPLSMTNPSALRAHEKSDDATSRGIDSPAVQHEEYATKQGGVVRVGESEDLIEMKTARTSDSVRELARGAAPRASSIPDEYLEGIRDWLNSPPINTGESDGPSSSRQSLESALAAAREPVDSTPSGFAAPESPAQNEIHEFSLSIGSIRIVVEDPAPPKQQVNNVQPQTTASVNPAPRTHDAFALSRRYFRGL